jgi:hypothetical protein
VALRAIGMREFTYRILDDRQSDPMVRRVRVRDEHEAVKLARRILSETYHHHWVEMWYGEQRVLVLRRSEA